MKFWFQDCTKSSKILEELLLSLLSSLMLEMKWNDRKFQTNKRGLKCFLPFPVFLGQSKCMSFSYLQEELIYFSFWFIDRHVRKYFLGLFFGCMCRALARKLKLITFSTNWEISVYQRSSPWLATKNFLVQPVERWETPSWERNHHREMSFCCCFFHKLG